MWNRRVRERKLEVKMKWGREGYLKAAGVESVMEKVRIRGGASEVGKEWEWAGFVSGWEVGVCSPDIRKVRRERPERVIGGRVAAGRSRAARERQG